ncbi:hypothetical protein SAMN06265377_0450 [Flagellimonas pacifica]|uniref:Uncharacterized protein n=1 Tax=Flagellimonas pacifica TaxID=1247520 RepID=A0A285MCB6_9FLAO|nr:hypothetical protein SAMN06265377_0450 [Allomuricauda parva]
MGYAFRKVIIYLQFIENIKQCFINNICFYRVVI